MYIKQKRRNLVFAFHKNSQGVRSVKVCTTGRQ